MGVITAAIEGRFTFRFLGMDLLQTYPVMFLDEK